MRARITLLFTFVTIGCGSPESNSFSNGNSPGEGGEGPSGGGSSNGGSGGKGGSSHTGGSNGGSVTIGSPTQLTSGPAALLGTTSDGWAIFRDSDGLRAVNVEDGSSVDRIAEQPGTVLIAGSTVFNWADIDWTTSLGELSVWTANGVEELGETLYSEQLVAANETGSAVVYAANATDETIDLTLLSTELGTSQVLIEALGRGSEETCGARIGFVGERLFVGWCEVGSRAARLERFELVDDEWQPTLLADDVLPEWSADAEGDRIFYQTSAYAAHCAIGEDDYLIDASVGRGFILPDGRSVFYTVGDQLRRTSVPEIDPVPVVTRGYSQPVGFDSDYELALYSTTVTYEKGTQRDLFVVPTNEFNAQPVELVGEPIAELPRSSFTEDGQFVLYFTDRQPTGATLHVVDTNGTERLTLENVVEVAAAYGATIVFTENASDPTMYPIVSDLAMIDLENDTEPRVLEEKILDARSFAFTDSSSKVVYARSGIDREPDDTERDGLFVISIR